MLGNFLASTSLQQEVFDLNKICPAMFLTAMVVVINIIAETENVQSIGEHRRTSDH